METRKNPVRQSRRDESDLAAGDSAALDRAIAASSTVPPEPAKPGSTGANETLRPPSYSDKEVGQIIALATRLQIQGEASTPRQSAMSDSEILRIAHELGIQDRYLREALRLTRQDRHSFLLMGNCKSVQNSLLNRLSGLTWGSDRNPGVLVSPRISREESGQRWTIQWGEATLVLHLQEMTETQTEVAWETAFEFRNMFSKEGMVAIGALTAATALAIGAVGGGLPLIVLSASFPAVLGGIGAWTEKVVRTQSATRFEEFCRNQLENLQLLAIEEREQG